MATAPDGREYTPTEPGPHVHTPNEAECTICCDIADTILDRLQAERIATDPAMENTCPVCQAWWAGGETCEHKPAGA
jgi:hypothetical protein